MLQTLRERSQKRKKLLAQTVDKNFFSDYFSKKVY